ncbi:hypothetical protein BACIH_3367 [Bacillus amyloliquefaciens]|nr:hypothetical protein BACIT_2322 [Bacillus amyloliquefaciens]QEY95056.1 hypothetical protein BACIH_3367 [Bacillus amyloliquefaciens]RUR96937.1 hypothetical protein EFW57_03176 [Bacillus velezensis]
MIFASPLNLKRANESFIASLYKYTERFCRSKKRFSVFDSRAAQSAHFSFDS